MQTAKQLYKFIISKIVTIYGEQEANSLAFILMDYFKVSKQDYVLDNTIKINITKLESIIIKLQSNEPLQYVLGEAWFYDRKFYVDENVLIPRPETEELCHLIIENKKSNTDPLKILDIGTGSGCIPITLDLELENAEVFGLDISINALNIAKNNAELLKSKAKFHHLDILNDDFDMSGFDIVVSNPPYVLNSEKEFMKQNVLDNEPHLALFVENANPLLFYKRITELCVQQYVKELYFEINEVYGNEVVQLMKSNNYKNVFLLKDMFGKNRIVYGTL